MSDKNRPEVAGVDWRPWMATLVAICLQQVIQAQDQVPADAKPEIKPGVVREEQLTLPKYVDLAIPETEVLLRSRPFDWIVLKTQEAIVSEPIAQRPDLLGRLATRHEMAVLIYNRILKHKPYKDAELVSLRQYFKGADRAAEFDEREAQLKQELEVSRERTEKLKPTTFKLPITLDDGSVDPEFQLDVRFIDFVVYYEDLLLRRADELIEQGKTSLAYDLLLLVARRHRENNANIQAELEAEERGLTSRVAALEEERKGLRVTREELNAPKNRNSSPAKMRLNTVEKTIVAIAGEIKDLEDEIRGIRYKLRFARPREFPNPDPPRKDDLLLPAWPRFDEVYQRLIFRDSDRQVELGYLEEAVRLLDELWKPGHSVPGLTERLNRTVGLLITRCVEREDYRQARHFIGYLASRDQASATALKWQGDLTSRAANAIQTARAAAQQQDARLAAVTIDRGAWIWPDAAGLKDAHRELTGNYQILRVGVLHLNSAGPIAGLPTEADERIRGLTEARMFEPFAITEQGVRYRSAFFESWEPTDLGRRVQFRLKLRRADWEARPLVTSADIYSEILLRADSASPQFDERLAGFVDGITVQSPTEFTILLRQLPLRPEAQWQLTVAAGGPSRSLNEDALGTDRAEFGRERFQPIERDEERASYRRVRNQPSTTRQRRVDEVTEIHYESWDRALQGLLRGEVSMIPVVGLSDLKGLQDDNRFVVHPHAVSRTHFLMFNPRQAALQDGQFRRALLHGFSRGRLLKEIILKNASDTHGRLVTGPFGTQSYAYNRQLPQVEYDAPLAAALALTAKKQLGGTLPALKMVCPGDSQMREASLAMIAEWKRVGIEVNLLETTELNGDWDICYRTTKSIEPLTDVWPLLTMRNSADVEALQALSEPTRRLLLELERAVDWTTATKLLHRLVADLLIEARYIPLWEVDEYLVARKNISGIPSRPIHVYDDVERWTVAPWYPQEMP
jgi:hypothetical protein